MVLHLLLVRITKILCGPKTSHQDWHSTWPTQCTRRLSKISMRAMLRMWSSILLHWYPTLDMSAQMRMSGNASRTSKVLGMEAAKQHQLSLRRRFAHCLKQLQHFLPALKNPQVVSTVHGSLYIHLPHDPLFLHVYSEA